MTACTIAPAVHPSFIRRVGAALQRYFSRSVVTREAVDQAWLDSGLGRLSRSTLEDIGAPAELIELARDREAWKLAASLDATRHL